MRARQFCVFVIFTVLFNLIGAVCFSQSAAPDFKHLTRQEGLSSNKINCITEDKFGFIWLGTEDGISRYDGVRFKFYKTEDGLSDNYVNSISCDPENGDLWIGTRKGISFFNRKEERFYNNSNVLHIDSKDAVVFGTSILKIYLDKRNCLWVGTSLGLFYFNKDISNQKNPVFKSSRLISKKVVNDIFEDSKGRLWLGTGGLFQYDLKRNLMLPYKMPKHTANVRSIWEDSRKNLWVSTGDFGVFLIDELRGDSRHYSKGHSLLTNNITGVVEDEHGKIWIGAKDGGGLYAYDYTSSKVDFLSGHSNIPNDPKGITSNAITAIYRDKKGYIWVGTYAGLNYYDPYKKNFLLYKVNFKSDGLFNSNIRCFYQELDGKIWVGTRDEGGISQFDPQKGTFTNYKSNARAERGLTDGNVLSITSLDSDRLLIGTNSSGLFIFNTRTKAFTTPVLRYENAAVIKRGRIQLVHKDQKGTIWVGTTSSLCIYDPANSSLTSVLKIPSAVQIFEYDEDEIYIITLFSGMYNFNRKTGKLQHYTPGDKKFNLSNGRTNSIQKDNKGNLWIATNKGLNYFDVKKKEFKLYTVADGLPNNIICGILIDKHDNLWMSTVDGLVNFITSTGKINKFNIHDGLQGNEFEKGVCLQTSDGAMLFGGINGFNYFYPDSIRKNPLVPTVVLTDLKIFNKSASINSEESPLSQSISFEKKVRLSHLQSFLEFEFAGLSFTSPENNQYAYKLEGLEEEWNVAGNKTYASYTGLQPGEYVFRVKASNNDGVWSEDEVALQIEITPPWWQTSIFRWISAVVLLGLIIWLNFYRTRSLRMQKRKLDQLVKARTEVIRRQNKQLEESRDQVVKLNSRIKAISEYRMQYFTHVSHEFRTPLTLIIGPVNKLLSGAADALEIKENLMVIKRNAGRLLHLINELMDFRSIENKNLPLRVKKINLTTLVDEIAALFVELAKEKRITFGVEHENFDVKGAADATKIQKVVFNLIANAFNYTNSGGEISVRSRITMTQPLRSEESEITFGKWIKNYTYFEVSVRDSGVGIPEESLGKVFKEFYRESLTNIDTKGTGLGLSIVKELIRLHKGHVTVKSTVDIGSEFLVRVPINIDAYASEQKESPGRDGVIYEKGQVLDLLGGAVLQSKEGVRSKSGKGREHVLLVEDNEELLQFISQQLATEYRVSQARNGHDGLKAAIKYTPDIIISDVVMPGMSGVELLIKLKDDLKTMHIPVVLLTAKADIESQMEGMEAGADDYISKPFDVDLFRLRIRNLVQSRVKLRRLFSTSVEDVPVETGVMDQDSIFLEKVISIIRNNISNSDFGAGELADQMCVSLSLLQKKISKLTSYSPTEFILLYRMKKALELIKTSGLSVGEISEKVGFKDPYYFSRCFKKHFGKSPKLYAQTLGDSR
ncbi:signal transduction histidine kinase [Arcticibacter pallidicorallinus]|uniref:histidine kinase n=1 Tax=Arcticibacter pallidicorallinus TaxID=1259464 RepID=A0A2T0U5X7_9SPHI|nr:two-component regulator propeller domain-containing protein [Arcticibacter pallidicorallinus]PRY53292.1 signal transduction histidine kinase [Arcticibacter pallidicorallinus]